MPVHKVARQKSSAAKLISTAAVNIPILLTRWSRIVPICLTWRSDLSRVASRGDCCFNRFLLLLTPTWHMNSTCRTEMRLQRWIRPVSRGGAFSYLCFCQCLAWSFAMRVRWFHFVQHWHKAGRKGAFFNVISAGARFFLLDIIDLLSKMKLEMYAPGFADNLIDGKLFLQVVAFYGCRFTAFLNVLHYHVR